jgi:hypothetical protein
LKGKRDRAMLAVMIGCGLRREEVARLRFEDIRQREGRWVIVDLRGKHGRVRSIPMPGWAKAAIDQWAASAEIHASSVRGSPSLFDRISDFGFSYTEAATASDPAMPTSSSPAGKGVKFRNVSTTGSQILVFFRAAGFLPLNIWDHYCPANDLDPSGKSNCC